MGSAPAASLRTIIIGQKNTTTAVVQNELSNSVGTFLTFPASDDVTFAAADTLRLQLYQSTGAAWPIANGLTANSPGLLLREIPAW